MVIVERLGTYKPEEVLPFVSFLPKKVAKNNPDCYREYEGHKVKMWSQRYKLFAKKGTKCVKCGVLGEFFRLERHEDTPRFHLNLYGVNDKGKEVMLTKDHIIPKYVGGTACPTNLQVLCFYCNCIKGCKIERKEDVQVQ